MSNSRYGDSHTEENLRVQTGDLCLLTPWIYICKLEAQGFVPNHHLSIQTQIRSPIQI